MYGILAELTVVAHLGWILFLVLGALLGRRLRWIRRLHLAGLGFAVLLTALGWICPLTHLEVWLWQRAGAGGGYRGSFIGHYAERLVYLQVPRAAVLAGTCLVLAATLLAYTRWKRPNPPQGRKRE
jgi:hypothetical protein